MNYIYKQLLGSDIKHLKGLLKVFGEAFGESDNYQSAIPTDIYLRSLLSKPYFIVLVAMDGSEIVGGLVAYELEKFEQDRREIFIYDLAVSEAHRRKGIATELINKLKNIAKNRKAYIIFVQADKADIPAITLYESLGVKTQTLNFDIPIDK